MPDYPNRSDLRGPTTARFTGQTYGEAKAQEEAQRIMPPGRPPTDVTGRPRPGAAPFARPTERPTEPVTAGADFGAGPSAAEAGIRARVFPFDDAVSQLKALYTRYPNERLRAFIARYQDRVL